LLTIVILDLRDRGKRYFNYFTIRAFHLHAGGREGLSGLHAPNNAPDALSINRYNLDIVLAVERLQGSKCFGNFHAGFFLQRSSAIANELN
jgi:hypothetical protein